MNDREGMGRLVRRALRRVRAAGLWLGNRTWQSAERLGRELRKQAPVVGDWSRRAAVATGAGLRWLGQQGRAAVPVLGALARELMLTTLAGLRVLGRLGLRIVPVLRWVGGAGASLAARAGARAKRLRWSHIVPQAVAVGVVAAGLSWVPYTTCGFRGCPDVDRLTVYQPNGAPVLLDRNGEPFGQLAPFERRVVALEELPPYVPAAFLAVEDKRFYRHNGVDWLRVAGAALVNLRHMDVRQGSSTISMQLARNVFPEDVPAGHRTFRRKLLEMRVAREIEQRFSKDEILELYLNHIYFGGGAWGIEAAARRHFGKGASELTLAEAAVVAGMTRAPTNYDPRRQPERSRARRDLVLALMAEQNLVDPAEAEAARASPLRVPTDPPRDRSGVPLGAYFVDIVRDRLDAQFGERLYRTGIRIHTTLDVTAQRAAERELESRLNQLDKQVRRGEGPLQGAVVVMEAATGDVLALVGGRDPTTSRYNRATLGRRQLGSAFKPFVYATALGQGYMPSQVLMDAPVRVQLSRNDVWQPGNYDGRFEGPVSLREALVRSRNVPAVRLASAVGLEQVVATARGAGITGRIDATPALALGTPSVTPLELATAYSTFATLGTPASPRFIVRVEEDDGRILWQPELVKHTRTMSSAVAYILTDMLRDAVDRGTGTGVRTAGYRGPVAGKTGTTNDATDVWFAGYTPDLVGTVWIGYDRPSSLGNAATGGGLAAPVWGRIMREVYSKRAVPNPWTPPDSVRSGRVDPESGLLLAEGCYARYGDATADLYIVGREPGYVCPTRGNWFADLWAGVGRLLGRPAEPRQSERARQEAERQRREWERMQNRR